jgi:hypothetical protein
MVTQDRRANGVFIHMDADDTVVHIERVCCLECGTNYVKPAEGTTAQSNPGCPTCGYLGWISAVVPMGPPIPRTSRARPPRYGEDLRPSRAVRRR